MLHLDVRSAALIAMAVLLLMTGAMVLLWRTSPEDREARLWAGGYGLISFGVLLIALRGAIPVFLSIPFGNTIVITGMMVLLGGIRVFFDKPVQWGLTALVSGVVLLLFINFTYVVPDIKARIIVTSTCVTWAGGWMVWELVKDFDRRMGLQQGLVIAAIVLFCLFMVVRMAFILTGPPMARFMAPETTVSSLMFLIAAAVAICLTFGFSAMINRRLHLHLDHLASYDMLTGAYNRRAFEEARERELARSQRHGTALAVLLLDLDHFKQINDHYGHAFGDRVLRQAAQTIKTVLRIEDTLGRIGGEEFCVLLPQTDREEVAKIAERIRSAVAAQITDYNGQQARVTVSIGVAMADAQTRDWETVFQAADQALYRAKQEGRNRIAA